MIAPHAPRPSLSEKILDRIERNPRAISIALAFAMCAYAAVSLANTVSTPLTDAEEGYKRCLLNQISANNIPLMWEFGHDVVVKFPNPARAFDAKIVELKVSNNGIQFLDTGGFPYGSANHGAIDVLNDIAAAPGDATRPQSRLFVMVRGCNGLQNG